ncbi:MAG: hypothetical protein NUV73_00460 [Candidatus Daviesbacteria bacterium]|nr:hypothetical protein [Candidatus Daviesbacteria bacterium]
MSKMCPVFSVYLGSDGKVVPTADLLSAELHSLVHQNLSAVQRNKWQRDIKKIEDFLHQFVGSSNTRSYVFFTSGKNLWQVLNFEFFLPPLCKISNYPYKKPLEEAVEKYRKYLVVLADREKARLFTVHLGKIEEYKDIFDDQVPQKVKAKKIDYGRDNKIFRHIEDHLHRHLQVISKATKDFTKGKIIHFIILGGHKELLPKIKAHLPYPLKEKVLGEFVTELNIPLGKVLLFSKKIAAQINQGL